MSEVVVRPADALDLPVLQQILKARFPDWEQVSFKSMNGVWIAESDGVPFASISVRAIWQVEPLLVFNESVPDFQKKKGALLLYRAVEQFFKERAPTWSFLHTLHGRVGEWMEKLGWHRCYEGGAMYAKDFLPEVKEEDGRKQSQVGTER